MNRVVDVTVCHHPPAGSSSDHALPPSRSPDRPPSVIHAATARFPLMHRAAFSTACDAGQQACRADISFVSSPTIERFLF
ncbi:hypothetical protein [Actinoalloteichus sp. GBA129-24]|uniref:hypothetical protein n=1 Tax=Actinoalloteichus sp. GBA129-24 TaxID=1612551 RepID=UPI0012F9B0D5|nr:hypothetical protein [Actinoalloteichus sp. GBA129-24]